jgi:L-ribulose-5-phosphate 4-epimerase
VTEGVIKFRCDHNAREVEPFTGFEELNRVRRKLLQLRLVGVDAQGIGYGNLSVRAEEPGCFYITGSGTGGVPLLQLRHVAKVVAFDCCSNWLRCEGATVASSESLTHGAIYTAAPDVQAVIHCHDDVLWRALCDSEAATPADAEYGTPAMAGEVQQLLRDSVLRQQQIFAMRGHSGGVVAFGGSVEEAFAVLLQRKSRA